MFFSLIIICTILLKFNINIVSSASCNYGLLDGSLPMATDVCQGLPLFGDSWDLTCDPLVSNVPIVTSYDGTDTCENSFPTNIVGKISEVGECNSDDNSCNIIELRVTNFENSDCTGDIIFQYSTFLNDFVDGECIHVGFNEWGKYIVNIIEGYSLIIHSVQDCTQEAFPLARIQPGCDIDGGNGFLFEFSVLEDDNAQPTQEPTEEPI